MKGLHIYEELMLLALNNKKGRQKFGFSEYSTAGAVVAELLLDGRIKIEDEKKLLVRVIDASPTGDPVIDECLRKMSDQRRRSSVQTWVQKLARIKHFRVKILRQLCERKIVREDPEKVLFFFTVKTYPEINPVPEQRIVARIRKAIFDSTGKVDAKTAVLIALADGNGMLADNFTRKALKPYMKRIEQIINGDMISKATNDVIQSVQAAVIVAAVMPAMVASTSASCATAATS